MKDKLVNQIKAYFEDKSEVIAVYLFGSQATGKKDCSSDVDVGILLNAKDRTTEIEKRNQYMVDLADILRKEIHPIILNSAGEELMRQIEFCTGRKKQVFLNNSTISQRNNSDLCLCLFLVPEPDLILFPISRYTLLR